MGKNKVEDYLKNKNLFRPENIIKGIDPVAVGLVKQIYSALLDRGENVVLYEKIWLQEIEKAYKDQQTYNFYFINGLEGLLRQAYSILTNDTKTWGIKQEEILVIAEKILFLKIREDIYKEFYDEYEQALFSAIQLDFTKRVNFPQIGNTKENLFSYKAVMLNTLLETMENSVVSMNAVNKIVSDIPGLLTIISNKDGSLRFMDDECKEILGCKEKDILKLNICNFLTDFNKIKLKIDANMDVTNLAINLVVNNNQFLELPARLTIKYNNDNSTVEELIYLIKINQPENLNTNIDIKQKLHDKIVPVNTLLSGLDIIGEKLIDEDSKKILIELKNIATNLKLTANEELKTLISSYNNPIDDVSLINFEELTNEIINNFDGVSYTNIKFNKEIESSNNFYSKSKLIQPIVLNLLSNAIKCRKKNKLGIIKIKFFKKDTNNFVLQISDNGTGIKPEAIGDIFSSQFYSSPSLNENGMELMLVNNYVKKLKGTIHVESVYGKYTTFTITLPNMGV